MPQVNPTPALPWGQASTGKDGALGSVAQATEQQLEQEHLANPDQVGLAIADGGELSSPPSKRRRADPLSSDVEQPNHLGLALSDVGLQIGRRIEVKWQVENDQDGTIVKWWGAKVVGPSPDPESTAVSHAFQILYDAWGEFEAEMSIVRFLDGFQLFDTGCSVHPAGFLRWRMEGDLDDDSEDEDAEAVHGSEVVTMAELQEEFTDGDAEAIEQQAMLELSMLPRERQQHIAAGFRNMVDRVKEGLEAIVGTGDGSKTITAEDIKNIFRGLHKAQP